MHRDDSDQNMRDEITPLIITRDEAPNIARTLDKLVWARRIVVIDSGSTDDTMRIAQSYPQVEVIAHPFADFASQCNFGLTRITSPWVLSLDADYELADDLVRELQALRPPPDIAGYRARFVYRIFGRRLRGTLYPPRTVLYRRERARYRNEGHGHRVVVDGAVLDLSGAIYHDDRKPLARWFASQQRYARIEAEHLLTSRPQRARNRPAPPDGMAGADRRLFLHTARQGMPARRLGWLVLRAPARDRRGADRARARRPTPATPHASVGRGQRARSDCSADPGSRRRARTGATDVTVPITP